VRSGSGTISAKPDATASTRRSARRLATRKYGAHPLSGRRERMNPGA
jgi:hypothetical protein